MIFRVPSNSDHCMILFWVVNRSSACWKSFPAWCHINTIIIFPDFQSLVIEILTGTGLKTNPCGSITQIWQQAIEIS